MITLPGYNCQQCGQKTCADLLKTKQLNKCPFYKRDKSEELRSVIDNCKVDFVLSPLNGEPSCREYILPVNGKRVKVGDYIRYRPLGCPIIHFAKVIEVDGGMLCIHLVGPRITKRFKEMNTCLVMAFKGRVTKGKIPDVCETVRFLPERCMMSKCHVGVVVQVEKDKIRIDGIDLKVWARDEKKT